MLTRVVAALATCHACGMTAKQCRRNQQQFDVACCPDCPHERIVRREQ